MNAGDTISVSFDFSNDMSYGESIATKVVIATVVTGTDALPSDIVDGTATLEEDTVVSQKISGAETGVVYELLCTVTTSTGQTLEQASLLAIEQ